MEEKVIAVGKEYLIKKVIGVVCLLPLALFVFLCFAMLSPAGSGGGSAVVMLLVYGLPLLAIAIGFFADVTKHHSHRQARVWQCNPLAPFHPPGRPAAGLHLLRGNGLAESDFCRYLFGQRGVQVD